MKLRTLFILAISLLCMLTTTSCAPEPPEAHTVSSRDVSGEAEGIMSNQIDNKLDTSEFSAENRIENTRPLLDILTNEYAIEDLVDFFGRASSNESSLSGLAMSDVRIATASKKFPIECLRQVDAGFLYSVYKVKEGGLYYVFWADIVDTEDTIVDWAVYFTVYLPTSIKLASNDFNSIIPNRSTAEDVAVIDPNFELSFLLSSRIASYSLLEDGSVMEICYGFDTTPESKVDLIVTSKEILSGVDSSSKLAAIYPYDLP